MSTAPSYKNSTEREIKSFVANWEGVFHSIIDECRRDGAAFDVCKVELRPIKPTRSAIYGRIVGGATEGKNSTDSEGSESR